MIAQTFQRNHAICRISVCFIAIVKRKSYSIHVDNNYELLFTSLSYTRHECQMNYTYIYTGVYKLEV